MNKLKNKRWLIVVLVAALALGVFAYVKSTTKETGTDYTNSENWAYYAEGEGDADLFFVCPTVDMGKAGNYNMSLEDEDTKSYFVGASLQELGVYDQNAVVYEPYYQQVAFTVYSLSDEEAEPYFDIAYADVKDAFEEYLKESDSSRPLILAGFSQGADMVIRLLKDFGNDETVADRLVAAYAIGWRLTKEEVEEYPWIVPATAEDDTGVIVMFECEAESVTGSIIVPEDTWTYSINPLNWKTDGTVADASENLGGCFYSYSGELKTEIPEMTGAYIDSERGTLKCPDIDIEEYSSSLFNEGVYHLCDYEFFYRNLQQNVATRLAAWQAQH